MDSGIVQRLMDTGIGVWYSHCIRALFHDFLCNLRLDVMDGKRRTDALICTPGTIRKKAGSKGAF
ncbi:hypothetical protein [Oxalobacter paraformigenes]|uniref:hypothetical protein n=1 Tax=Oxalobacter paraformigenes TaxID=556268 RepID=UPI0011C917A3|nr:hypothetical protein [Oxalobacter paraformigenes]